MKWTINYGPYAEALAAEMISDPDIWRAAQLIVKRHRADAPIVAAQRADELFTDGDLDGAAAWRCILHAVEALQRVTPREGERVN